MAVTTTTIQTFNHLLAQSGGFWGLAGAACGGYEIGNAIRESDPLKGVIGAGNVLAGSAMTMASFSRTLPTISGVLGGATQETIVQRSGVVMLGLAITSAGYKAYQEKGTGPDDRLSYQLARGAVSGGAIGACIAGCSVAGKFCGTWGTAISGLGAAAAVSLPGHYLIDKSKEDKLAARAQLAKEIAIKPVMTNTATPGSLVSNNSEQGQHGILPVIATIDTHNKHSQNLGQNLEISSAQNVGAIITQTLPNRGDTSRPNGKITANSASL